MSSVRCVHCARAAVEGKHTLTCLHYICKQCVRGSDLLTEDGQFFSCPDCKTKCRFRSSLSSEEKEETCQSCHEHGTPVSMLCRQCDEFICTQCTANRHYDHKPLIGLDELVKSLNLEDELAKVRTSIKPRVEKSLATIHSIRAELKKTSEQVRNEIREAGRRAIEAVQQCVEQKLKEVDEIERERSTQLDEQRQELTYHLCGVDRAIEFGDQMMTRGSSPVHAPLLYMLGKRCNVLNNEEFTEEPGAHSALAFQSCPPEQLDKKLGQFVGDILPCEASAKHCVVQGGHVIGSVEGEPTSFHLKAHDRRGEPLSTGGDFISTTWLQSPTASSQLPPATVKDNDNGDYVISCLLSEVGEHSLEVNVNGEKLSEPVTIIHHGQWCFDPTSCQGGITVAEDGDQQVATHSGDRQWGSVLGFHGFQHGTHTWSVKVNFTKEVDNFVGVAIKGDLEGKGNYKKSFSWANNGQQWVLGDRSKCMESWKDGDVLLLELDCGDHTLKITNQRSGGTGTINNLPDKELHQYFAMYYTRSKVSFV